MALSLFSLRCAQDITTASLQLEPAFDLTWFLIKRLQRNDLEKRLVTSKKRFDTEQITSPLRLIESTDGTG